MGRLFVPLDVNYAEDEKIVEVGPMAELLYVRGLVFAKRARSNGIIRRNQLSIVALRIPRPGRLAERLVLAGLWDVESDGWYITAWLKRNTHVEDISAVKAEAGGFGAHTRWHVKGGQPKPDCEWCLADGLVDP